MKVIEENILEKLDETGERLEQTPQKSLWHLGQQSGISTHSAYKATKLLHLKPYIISVVQELRPQNPIKRLHFLKLYFTELILWKSNQN